MGYVLRWKLGHLIPLKSNSSLSTKLWPLSSILILRIGSLTLNIYISLLSMNQIPCFALESGYLDLCRRRASLSAQSFTGQLIVPAISDGFQLYSIAA